VLFRSNTKELEVLEEKLKTYKPIQVEEISRNLNLLNEKLAECDVKVQDIGKQVASLETKN
jgi:archaellum component FlaC